MPVVDNKIVSMEFDNARFESGVATSLETIALLKKQLNSLSTSADFDSLTQESGKFNFGLTNMASSIKGLSDSFSSLGIVGIAALSRLTNAAIDAGKALVNSLTITPVTAGWDKYEKTITATKTIMNATNKEMKEVEDQLDRLSFFSDETSYSFVDMSDAVGKFTANGQDLAKSVTAVQGIATWAATSGQNTQTANAIMYQLSQAVGAGVVRSQDWKSVETMNMATEEFKQTAIDTAIALGKLDKAGRTFDGLQVTTSNFKQTLEKDWFSADVFIATLTKYGSYADEVYKVAREQQLSAADAMEWMKANTTYADAFGEKVYTAAQEAKTLTDAINATKDAVSSGWSLTSKLIFGNYEEARILFTDLAGAMNDIFASGGVERNKMLLEWKQLGGRTELINALTNAWNNLMAAIEPIKQAWQETFPPMTGQTLYNITLAFRKLTESFKMGEALATNLKKAFKALFGIWDLLLSGIGFLISKIFELGGAFDFSFDKIWNGIGWVSDLVSEFVAAVKSGEAYAAALVWLGGVIESLKVAFGPVIDYLTAFYDKIKEIFTTGSLKGIGDFFGSIAQSFTNFINSIKTGFSSVNAEGVKQFSSSIVQNLTPVETIGKVLERIFGGLKEALNKVIPFFVGIGSVIGSVLGKVGASVGAFFNDFSLQKLFDFVNNVLKSGLLAGLVALVAKFYALMGKSKNFLDVVVETLDEVRNSLKAYQDNLRSKTIMTIALALAVLTAAIVVLSNIDTAKLGKALAAMGIMFTMLIYTFKTFNSTMSDDTIEKVAKVSFPLVSLGLAILFLSMALKRLSSIPFSGLITGLIAMTALFKIMVSSVNSLRATSKNLQPIAFSLIIFAGAIWLLSRPLLDLAAVPFGSMLSGLIGVAGMLAIIGNFLGSKATNFKKIMEPKTMFGLIVLASAMNIMAMAVKSFANIDPGKLVMGLVAFAAIGYGLTLFIKQVGNPKDMIKSAASVLVFAVALRMFGTAISFLGKLAEKTLLQGLFGMAVGLTIMGVALKLLAKPDILVGAAALMILAVALNMLAPVLLILGLMNLQMLGMALLGLAGIFAVFGVSALILAPIIPIMLALSVSMLLVSVATISLGLGLHLLSLALLTLAATAPIGGAALILVLTSLIMLIPLTLVKIAEGIIEFARIVGEGALTIAAAFGQVFTAILQVLFAQKLIVITETVKFIVALLQVLYDAMPMIVELGMGIILRFIEGFNSKLGELTDAAVTTILTFINAIRLRLDDIIETAVLFIVSFIEGLAESVKKNGKAIAEAVWDLIWAIISAVASFVGSIVESAAGLLDSWIGGLGTAITGAWNDIVNLGKDIIKAVIEGIGKMASGLWNSVVDTVESAWNGLLDWLGIESPSKKMAYVGENMGKGLIVGIDKMSGGVADATENLGKEGVTGLSKSMEKIANSMDDTTAEFHPTIMPVVDMTNFNESLKSMSEKTTSAIDVKSLFSLTQAKVSVGAISASSPNTGNDITDLATKATLMFTQNNYSPKALSRLDIYRQTKNQFSALKGLVTGN